jgi:hypothetical protein
MTAFCSCSLSGPLTSELAKPWFSPILPPKAAPESRLSMRSFHSVCAGSP